MWKIFTLICASWILAESKTHHEIKDSICDPLANNTNSIQCYCIKNSLNPEQIKIAECFLTTKNVNINDSRWSDFSVLANVSRLTLTNTKGISLDYIPTSAISHVKVLTKLIITYGNIEEIPAYAFANLTNLQEIKVKDNNIKYLKKLAFAHLKSVTSVSLDYNNVEEINRDVFVDLPSLDKLYLSGNKITTIHDRAFMHLSNLRELELDKNQIFSLNSETFHGLGKLDRLVLSNNALEVIGANTFVHLVELRSLSLNDNRLQMLDENAFNGLNKLAYLSLSRNRLTDIDNVNTFRGLHDLSSLNLRDNQIKIIKTDVMAPIITNFYTAGSFFDYEGNKFPCDCHLDWFLTLRNKTQSTPLRNNIENLKCYPSDALRESWKKVSEADQTEQPQEEEPQSPNDYEYYDDSQLNGTLFYTDVRFLLHCPGTVVLPNDDRTVSTSTKAYTSPVTVKSIDESSTSTTPVPTTKKAKVTNHGLLDLSELATATTDAPNAVTDSKREMNKVTERNEKKSSPTTTRLATVSAKPLDKSYDERDMASDEAQPEKPNARRRYREEVTEGVNQEEKTNNSQRNAGCVTLNSIIIMLSLRSFL